MSIGILALFFALAFFGIACYGITKVGKPERTVDTRTACYSGNYDIVEL
jgi:flagellar biogenesis protein FliO